MKFLSQKFLFIKVEVSSIFKGKKIQDGTRRIRSQIIGSAVHHFNLHHRGFASNNPNPNPNPNPSPYEPLIPNPNPNPNPYFVYESLICQRQAICVTEIKDGGDKARVSGERNLLQQTQ